MSKQKPMTVRQLLSILLSLGPKYRRVKTNVVNLSIEYYESRKRMKVHVVADLGLLGNWTVETMIANLIDLGSGRLDYETTIGSVSYQHKRVELANLYGYTQASDIKK